MVIWLYKIALIFITLQLTSSYQPNSFSEYILGVFLLYISPQTPAWDGEMLQGSQSESTISQPSIWSGENLNINQIWSKLSEQVWNFF